VPHVARFERERHLPPYTLDPIEPAALHVFAAAMRLRYDLTPRQSEVLYLVNTGRTTVREAADAMCCSTNAVKEHRYQASKKIGCALFVGAVYRTYAAYLNARSLAHEAE
jgi:DNA-binding CsgD family transcriptional regulator